MLPLRIFAASAFVWLLAGGASADAIRSFDGACPPGLERAIRNHREVCVPQACLGASDCPTGAGCTGIFECWARRPVPPNPRLAPTGDAPEVDTVIGLCDAERHCEEGVCRERRQCEPTDATPSWDATGHHWTETPYVAPSSCAAGHAGSSPAALFSLALVIAALARRRA